jgi:hypothetical protein
VSQIDKQDRLADRQLGVSTEAEKSPLLVAVTKQHLAKTIL